MARILRGLAAVAVAVMLLGACGDDSPGAAGGRYCDELETAKSEIDALRQGDFGTLADVLDRIRDLAEEAPDEIQDDWETLVDGVGRLVDAIEAAGLTEEDLAGLQSGEMPDGVDMDALQELTAQLQELDSPEFRAATENVGTHAKEECDLELFPPDG